MVIVRLLRRGLLLMMFAVALSFATDHDNSERIETDDFFSRFFKASIAALTDAGARAFLGQKRDRSPVAVEADGSSSPAAAGALAPTATR